MSQTYGEPPIKRLLLERVYETDIASFARQGRKKVKAVHMNEFLRALESQIAGWVEDRVQESMAGHKARLFEEVNDEVFEILERAVEDAASNAHRVKEIQGAIPDGIQALRSTVADLFQDLKKAPKKLEKEVDRLLETYENATLATLQGFDSGADTGEAPNIDEKFCEDARDAIEELLTD